MSDFTNRIASYQLIDEMVTDPDIHLYIDAMVGSVIYPDEKDNIFSVVFNNLPMESEICLVKGLLTKWKEFSDLTIPRVTRMVWNTVKYGDSFFIRQNEPGRVYPDTTLFYVDPRAVKSIRINDKTGEKSYQIANLSPQVVANTCAKKIDENIFDVEEKHLMHLRVFDNDTPGPFGVSVLQPFVISYKRKVSVEDRFLDPDTSLPTTIQDVEYYGNALRKHLGFPFTNDKDDMVHYVKECLFDDLCYKIMDDFSPVFDQEFKMFIRSNGINIPESLFKIRLKSPKFEADVIQLGSTVTETSNAE